MKHLKPVLGDKVFFDEQLDPGTDVHESLADRLARTILAVPLVTPGFFNAPYVKDTELPRLTADMVAGHLAIAPVFLKDSVATRLAAEPAPRGARVLVRKLRGRVHAAFLGQPGPDIRRSIASTVGMWTLERQAPCVSSGRCAATSGPGNAPRTWDPSSIKGHGGRGGRPGNRPRRAGLRAPP